MRIQWGPRKGEGHHRRTFRVGQRVYAVTNVTEDGTGTVDPTAPNCYADGKFFGGWAHALPGDVGTVIGIDDGRATVRFKRTGSATVVRPDEVTAYR